MGMRCGAMLQVLPPPVQEFVLTPTLSRSGVSLVNFIRAEAAKSAVLLLLVLFCFDFFLPRLPRRFLFFGGEFILHSLVSSSSSSESEVALVEFKVELSCFELILSHSVSCSELFLLALFSIL